MVAPVVVAVGAVVVDVAVVDVVVDDVVVVVVGGTTGAGATVIVWTAVERTSTETIWLAASHVQSHWSRGRSTVTEGPVGKRRSGR